MGACFENKCHVMRHLLHVRSLHRLEERRNFLVLPWQEGRACFSSYAGKLKIIYEIKILRLAHPNVLFQVLRFLFFPYQGFDFDIEDLLTLCI